MKVRKKPPILRMELSQGDKNLRKNRVRVELSTYDLPDDADIGIGVYVFEDEEMIWHGMLCLTCDVERFVKLFGSFLPIILEHKRVLPRRDPKSDEKRKDSQASQEKSDRLTRAKTKRSVVVRKKRSQRYRN